MIVERELEIEAFEPKEYWTIEADAALKKANFDAKLTHLQGKKLSQFTINNETGSAEAVAILTKAADGKLLVTNVSKKQRKRNPAAPFTTSTLQQEASRKLGFGAQRTMSVAQQLYEGVDTGEGAVGLITYMRTDSVSLANEAVEELRGFIAEKYGAVAVPKAPQVYKTKSKNAQEAHEAVRPTSISRTPESLKSYLPADQHKLYTLIWQRTLASQMVHATMNTVAVDLGCGAGNTLRANGSTVVNPGFMSVYLEGKDDSKSDKDERLLPVMEVGDVVDLKAVRPEQHFTEPPPRYSEASLVRSLEEHDIGRPSTYANIISTLLQREYVELEKKRFHPTDVGRVVGKFLVEHFTQYVDYGFTASLEGDLDAVSRGEKEWVPLLRNFWGPFKEQVETKDKEVQRSDVTQELLDEDCPKCGKKLSSRLGRSGRFIGCTAYPECDYTRNVDGEETTASEPEVVADRKCPKCESDLWVRIGKYGKFIGCSSYPKCKHIESLEQPTNTGVDCPQCKKGEILVRKSRRGKIFYSCSGYPECDYALWNEPVKEPCPDCEWPILTTKTTKSRGAEKVCPQKSCGYTEKVETE
jgi:DNA topoisomerase-1